LLTCRRRQRDSKASGAPCDGETCHSVATPHGHRAVAARSSWGIPMMPLVGAG
jgi:hypothetical protein